MSAVAERTAAPTPERLALAEQVAELRARGFTHDEVAAALRISRSYASTLATDPDGAKQLARRARYQGTCERCGDPTDGSGGHSDQPKHCAACARDVQHEARYWTQDTIISRFKAFHEATGRVPTASESMCKYGAPSIAAKLSTARLREIEAVPDAVRLPHIWVVAREFGGWKNAVRAAGLIPSVTGGPMHRERSPGMRRFVVLEKNGVGFKPRATVEALSSAAAIQDVADGEGIFVAIPEQHWLERKVAPRTVFAVVEEPATT